MPKRILLIVLCVTLTIAACESAPFIATSPAKPTLEITPATPTETPLPSALQEIPVHVGRGARGSFFEIYFTDPANPASRQESGGIEGPLVASIDAAKLSVDVAIYSFSLMDVGNALLRARDRGVTVRVVMESDNLDRSVPRTLMESGVTVIGDRREGLMHDKFIVIDRAEVWTGSMNLTVTGAYDDNNNLLHIRSVPLAENYLAEFNEMFESDQFGTDSVPGSPNPSVMVDGVQIETYFSPDDGVAAQLMNLLQGAQESILFLAYTFTSDDLAQIIKSKHEAGIRVAGVMDNELITSNEGSDFNLFTKAGLNVRRDGNPGLMHDKIIIIDGSIVVTGSYNFTAAAENRNDENILVIHSKEIAEFYTSEFTRIFDLAQQP